MIFFNGYLKHYQLIYNTVMKLAIKGHPTRGKEVIELLEMLGGNIDKKILSTANVGDILNPHIYFFDSDSSGNRIVWYYLLGLECDGRASEMMIFTLEEFEQKFPYKVGDKVTLDKFPCEIKGMSWEYDDIIYYVKGVDFSKGVYSKDLQPYKEETTKESANKAIFEGNVQSCDIMNDIIKNDMEEKGDKVKAPNLVGEDYSGKRFGYKIPNGYEFDCIKNNEIILKPKQPQYPTTFKECCEYLSLGEDGKLYTKGYKASLIQDFQKLIICRNAYRKIAGEKMGLGKPWEPDWKDITQTKFVIFIQRGDIRRTEYILENRILAFPTEEMRDAFYKNFKDLIKECKELL